MRVHCICITLTCEANLGNPGFKEYRDYYVKTWGADIQRDDLIQLMRSSEFRPERFTELAQAVGMRYVVPFLKHHNGYCLWNS